MLTVGMLTSQSWIREPQLQAWCTMLRSGWGWLFRSVWPEWKVLGKATNNKIVHPHRTQKHGIILLINHLKKNAIYEEKQEISWIVARPATGEQRNHPQIPTGDFIKNALGRKGRRPLKNWPLSHSYRQRDRAETNSKEALVAANN